MNNIRVRFSAVLCKENISSDLVNKEIILNVCSEQILLSVFFILVRVWNTIQVAGPDCGVRTLTSQDPWSHNYEYLT